MKTKRLDAKKFFKLLKHELRRSSQLIIILQAYDRADFRSTHGVG